MRQKKYKQAEIFRMHVSHWWGQVAISPDNYCHRIRGYGGLQTGNRTWPNLKSIPVKHFTPFHHVVDWTCLSILRLFTILENAASWRNWSGGLCNTCPNKLTYAISVPHSTPWFVLAFVCANMKTTQSALLTLDEDYRLELQSVNVLKKSPASEQTTGADWRWVTQIDRCHTRI